MLLHSKTADLMVSGVKYIEKKPTKLTSEAPAEPGSGIKHDAIVTNA